MYLCTSILLEFHILKYLKCYCRSLPVRMKSGFCVYQRFSIFLSIVVFDKFHYGVHVGSRYFLLALLAQK